MKKKLIALVLMLALALTFGLVACGETTAEPKFKAGTYTAYGAVHTFYLGVADVTINGKGAVTKVSLDEYFLPHQYVTATKEGVTLPATALKKVATSLTAVGDRAKWFRIDGRVFEITDPENLTAKTAADPFYAGENIAANTTAGTPAVIADLGAWQHNGITSYYTKYKQISGDPIPGIPGLTSGVTDLTKWILSNDKVAEWWIKGLTKGAGLEIGKAATAATATAAGTFEASGIAASDYASGINKKAGKYWKTSEYYLGWLGNIAIIEQNFKEYFTAGTSLNEKNITRTDNVWTLRVMGNTVYTGATANDYAHYWNLCAVAYAKGLAASGVVTV